MHYYIVTYFIETNKILFLDKNGKNVEILLEYIIKVSFALDYTLMYLLRVVVSYELNIVTLP